MTGKNQTSAEEKRVIVSYFTEEITHFEMEILKNWLSKSEENRRLFNQFSEVWGLAGSFHFKNVDTDAVWKEIRQQIDSTIRSRETFRWVTIAKYAAVFAFALMLGAMGYYFFSNRKLHLPESSYVEFTAPLGSRSFVQLNDGSKIWLNAGTTLKYPKSFGTLTRELSLTGEAFFNVEKYKDLPFVVKTGEIDIMALGTRFNVKAYPEEETIETTLIEGSVKLVASVGKLAGDVVLKPNEKAVYTRMSNTLERILPQQNTPTVQKSARLKIIESIEPAPVISWKNKRWVIQNEKLGDLAVKLERRFDVNFIFENDELKQYSFGGTLENETLEQIMEAIGFSSPINYSIDKNTVYIMQDEQKIEKYKNLRGKR